MTLPKHTPFDGSADPFGIGLRPLDLENWIEVDHHLPRYLSEKHRLLNTIPDNVWAGDISSEAAQREAMNLLVNHLVERFPDTYSRSGDHIAINNVGSVDLEDVSKPPLLIAALLVQEDLVLMRKTAEGWRLVAASVCFPSSWVLREKVGKVMHDIHAPVPEFGKGTRKAMMIERVFDNLLVDVPVERFNWSVYNDDELYHDDRSGEHFPDHGQDDPDFFLRVEHQTLRKLPESGDILFTIRIHIDPIEVLEKRDDARDLAGRFIDTVNAMSADQHRYKGLDEGREHLIARLEAVRQKS